VTVRALESLIRLSEALARAHCDDIIRPAYVREVCRLLRNSNINISKNDIEFETIQEEINQERREEREREQQQIVEEGQQERPES
jgi:DNA replication licensing factor MCM6